MSTVFSRFANADILAKFTVAIETIAKDYTVPGSDSNSAINAVLVASSTKGNLSMSNIPDFFKPRVGQLQIRCMKLCSALVKAFAN